MALIQTLLRLSGPDVTNYNHNFSKLHHQTNKNQSSYAIFEYVLGKAKSGQSPMSWIRVQWDNTLTGIYYWVLWCNVGKVCLDSG